jgi:acetyl-CoA carboxylase biotin carboxyl carrier protein
VDLRKVKKLIELLEESNLNEMEIREGEESIRLSRGVPAVHHGTVASSTAPAPEAQPSAAVRYAGQDGSDSAQASDIPGGHQVTSPMVGTYYEAPEPDAAPFVSVGAKVEPGDTLCVIEAMKIFNQIESDTAGTVVHIQKTNGEAVEYGELLFVIQ